MQFKPLKHQITADRWLRDHDRTCLLLDMGLG